jgi:cyanate permease
MLALCCALALVSPTPLVFRPFSLYIQSWRNEFGWNTVQISMAFSLLTWAIAIAAPLVGRIVDTFAAKYVVRVFALIYCGSLLAITFCHGHLSLFLLSFAGVGFGGLGVSQILFTRLIARSFQTSMGAALSFVLGTIGAAAAITPLLVQRMIEALGWRSSLGVCAIAAFIVLISVSMLLRERSSGPGLALAQSTGTSARFFRTREFWVLTALAIVLVVESEACIAYLAPIVQDAGVSSSATGLAVALFGVGTLVGRFGTGFVLDLYPAKYAVFFSAVTCAAGLTLLLAAKGGMAILGCLLLGHSAGCEADVIPYLIKQLFGSSRFGQISGCLYAIVWSAAAAAVTLIGLLHDALGSYRPVLLCLLLCAIPATILTVRLDRKSPAIEPAVTTRVRA